MLNIQKKSIYRKKSVVFLNTSQKQLKTVIKKIQCTITTKPIN